MFRSYQTLEQLQCLLVAEFNMPLVKVTNSSFVRDTQSMAIINVDNQAKQEYYEKVRLLSKQKEQINKINDEIKELKNDVGEIKNLLKQLVSKE